MAKQLSSLEIFKGKNGGHRAVHNYEREVGKGTRGDLYVDRPQSEEHNFGPSEDAACLAHIGKALGMKGEKD